MSTATITLSHREYRTLLNRQRVIPVVSLSRAEKQALDKARKEMGDGDFVALDQLKHELADNHR